jgi:crotonobetainyl-CoA:carnitine CoA-transferase CaiB-like acyl-CoA transferase
MDKLLNGVRVLDVSVFSPVRFGTTVLADLGADVIQIDKPPRTQRADLEMLDSTEHPRWLWHGRNKRSVVIDLKRPDGREVFYDLLDTADAVVEGFAVGVAARLGVDYETLRARKPDIVYASVSGYGQTGPYAHLSGHEQNYQAMGGLTAASGGSGRTPDITPLPISDSVASLYSVVALLAALQRRKATGRGAYLDISVQDAVLSLFGYNANYLWRQGITQPRTIREFGGHPGVGVYPAADGRAIQLSVVEPWAWSAFCAAIGAEDLRDDYELDATRAMVVRGRLTGIFAERTRDEWVALNAEHDLGISPVLDLAELLNDPHVRARGMVNEVKHPTLGPIEQLATPIAVDGTIPASEWIPQPGDHTDSVLAGLGYSRERVEQLHRSGAIRGSGPSAGERPPT